MILRPSQKKVQHTISMCANEIDVVLMDSVLFGVETEMVFPSVNLSHERIVETRAFDKNT